MLSVGEISRISRSIRQASHEMAGHSDAVVQPLNACSRDQMGCTLNDPLTGGTSIE